MGLNKQTLLFIQLFSRCVFVFVAEWHCENLIYALEVFALSKTEITTKNALEICVLNAIE